MSPTVCRSEAPPARGPSQGTMQPFRMPSSSNLCCWSACMLMVALLGFTFTSVSADEYTYGRATFYDDNQQGSCKYFGNIPEWYGAWPDTQAGFPNCGTCWEVSCVDSDFSDGYGTSVDRSDACYDTSKSVVIKIVDSCPCVHQNFYSNQRWCCGDMHHLDLGRNVFQELADVNLGVIGLRWKPASCDQLGPRGGSSEPPAPPANNDNQGSSNNGNGGSSDNGNDGGKDGGNNGDSSWRSKGWQGWSGWSKPAAKNSLNSFGKAFSGAVMGGW